MTPTELRQAVPVEVQRHMRDAGVWPEGLDRWAFSDAGIPPFFALNCTIIADSHAAALIGWAAEGAVMASDAVARFRANPEWSSQEDAERCVLVFRGPERYPTRLHAIIAAYRVVCMKENK